MKEKAVDIHMPAASIISIAQADLACYEWGQKREVMSSNSPSPLLR